MKCMKNNKDTYIVKKAFVRTEVTADRIIGHPLPWQWFFVVEGFGGWLRFGYGYGGSPGSHRGLWRLHNGSEGRDGWALRIGEPFHWYCWTGLVHWRQQTLGVMRRV